MGHASFGRRGQVHVALIGAAFRGCHDFHVDPFGDLGKQDVLRVDPRQTRGVVQHSLRSASEHRHHPGIPQETFPARIRDA